LSCHFRAKRFAIGATTYLRLQRFHHAPICRFGCGAEFSNGFAHDFRQFVRLILVAKSVKIANSCFSLSANSRGRLFQNFRSNPGAA